MQGLSHSAGTYQKAVKYLQQGFDRPRFIHQKYVKTIVEIITIKVGTGRELRQLHDLVSQHVRSLRTVKGDTFESFMSSLIEMKLDQTFKFAWQQHTVVRMSEGMYLPSTCFLNSLIGGLKLRNCPPLAMLSGSILLRRRRSKEEIPTTPPQNDCARCVMRLFIFCMLVLHSRRWL